MSDRNEAIVRRFVQIVNDRDLDALDEVVAPDVHRHCPATPEVTVRSLKEFKAFLRSDLESVPDAVQTIETLVAQGDTVAAWIRFSGTQDGAMGPFPPTGKPVEIEFAGFLRLEDGRIKEIRVVWDNLSTLVRLGHIELPGR